MDAQVLSHEMHVQEGVYHVWLLDCPWAMVVMDRRVNDR